jgi:CelD/BcsL family acetyltransferase involved in cellulose biosynthesis
LPSGDQSVEWVESPEALAALAGEWDALAELPFQRLDWLLPWWDAFGGGRKLRTPVVRRAGRLVSAFPLCADGSRLQALSNIHTPVFEAPAVDEDARRAVVEAVVGALRSRVDVEAVADDGPTAAALADVCGRRGLLTYVERQNTSPLVRLDGDFDAFTKSMKKNHRKDIARCERRLEREHEDVVVRPMFVADDLDAEVERVFRVEESGWKAKRGTAILTDRQAAAFYHGIACTFHAAGRLRLSTLDVAGHAIASDFALLDGGRLWMLKGGYDVEYRVYGPTLILTLAEIECAYGSGLDAVELVGDLAEWKLKFANDERSHSNVRVYRRSSLAVAPYGYRRFVRPQLKRAYRRFRPSRG